MNNNLNELMELKNYVNYLIEMVLSERSKDFDDGYKYADDPTSYTSSSSVENTLQDIRNSNIKDYNNRDNIKAQEFIKGAAAAGVGPKIKLLAKDLTRDLRQQEYMNKPGVFGIKQHIYDDIKGAASNIPNKISDFSKTKTAGALAAGTAAAGLGVAGYAAYKLAKKRKAEKAKANKK